MMKLRIQAKQKNIRMHNMPESAKGFEPEDNQDLEKLIADQVSQAKSLLELQVHVIPVA